MWKDLIPVFAAIISAVAILAGYAYQKLREREFEIQKTRQGIYTRFVQNLMRKLTLFEQLRRDTRSPERLSSQNVRALYELIRSEYPEIKAAMDEAREIGALIALYGTDEAVQACAAFLRASAESLQSPSVEAPDPAVLLRDLRRSLFSRSRVPGDDIGLLISK